MGSNIAICNTCGKKKDLEEKNDPQSQLNPSSSNIDQTKINEQSVKQDANLNISTQGSLKNESNPYTSGIKQNPSTSMLNINNPNFICVKTVTGHSNTICCLIELFSGNIATGSYDQSIKIWDINTFEPVKEIKTTGKILCLLEFEPFDLLCGTDNNVIELYNINEQTPTPKKEYKQHLLWVNCITKCDNEYFASGSNDSDIIIWNYYDGQVFSVLSEHSKGILALITLRDGRLCSGSADLSIKIWNWKEGKCEVNLLGHLRWIKCLFELSDGSIMSGSDDKTIRIWRNNVCIAKLTEHQKSVRALCQISNNLIASGSFDNTIKIWDLNNNKCVQTLYGHSSNVICLLLNKTGYLISTSNDKTIKFWKS